MKYYKAYIFSICCILSHFSFGQGYQNLNLQFDGNNRSYSLYVPDSYTGNESVPLIFNFHGGGDDISSQIYLADMSPIADTANCILVYPQALSDPNDGGSNNWIHKDPTDVDDVYFVEALINAIDADYNIDRDRVYACGYSLGGEFTYELACRLNDQIAAVGAVSRTMGGYQEELCNPQHPTGILTILGTADLVSPYEGLEFGGVFYYISADAVHNYWNNYNNITSAPMVIDVPDTNPSDGSTVEHYIWGQGDGCVNVEHFKVIGGDHDWPGTTGNMDINSSLEIWRFVSRYNRNGLIGCSTNTTSVSQNTTVRIYPNPVSASINLLEPIDYDSKYQILSLDGSIIQEGILRQGESSLKLNSFPNGLYFLKLENLINRFVRID
jgi:polyhydroxybutyrate depolymerase